MPIYLSYFEQTLTGFRQAFNKQRIMLCLPGSMYWKFLYILTRWHTNYLVIGRMEKET